jgi:tripartite-type tricarboxylate transporter receptor subunit TctC
MVESGFPSFTMPGWGGWITAAGTPKDVVEKLNAEVQRTVAIPEVRQRLIAVGMEPPPTYGPAQVGAFIARDIERWMKFVEAVGADKLKGAQ